MMSKMNAMTTFRAKIGAMGIMATVALCISGCMGPHVEVTDSALFDTQSWGAPQVKVVRLPNYPVVTILADQPVVVRLVCETSNKVLDEKRVNMHVGLCKALEFAEPQLAPGQYRIELLSNGRLATSRSFTVVK